MISYEIDLAIVIAIFVIGLILSFKNLKWGFFYVLSFIPLMHKELFSFIVWDLLPIRLAVAALSVAAFIKTIIFIKNRGFRKFKDALVDFIKYDPFLILMSTLWLIRGLSIFKSALPEYSLSLFAFYSIVVALYILFKYLISEHGEKFYGNILCFYYGIAGFTVAFAILQFYLRQCCRLSIGGVWVVPGYLPRLGSTFWDVNHYGGFLITIIPILFAYLFIAKRVVTKIIVVLSIGIFAWLLFMTQSRSAWIGLSVGMAISLVIYYWNSLKKPLLITGMVIILGITGLLGYTTYKGISIRAKVANFMHYRLDSTDTHIMLLKGASQVFFNNMWIGSGYGGFDPAFRMTEIANDYFDREPKLKDIKVPPHSVWGEVIGETGGLGIVTYGSFAILIIASLLVAIFKSKSRDKKYLGIGLLGSVFALFAGGIFYSYNIEFYWLTLFLAIGYILISFDVKYDFMYVLNWWKERKVTPYVIIAPLAAFYIFLDLGGTTLIDWDEAIYAKVARNIVETNDWVSLRWDDMSNLWYEKPPLYMWLTALIFKVTNFNSLGARLASAVFGFLGVLLIYKFGSRIYNRLTGLFAALILLSTAHYLYYARNGMLDVTVSFFIIATIYFMYLAFENKKNAMWFAAIAGIFLGLGVMTKAIIGLIPLPVLFLYWLYLVFAKKDKASFFKFIPFVLTALLVAAPWHIYSYILHKDEFVDEYFFKHIINRGLSGLGHEKPLWWFLEVIKVSFRIWIVPFAFGIVSLFFIDKSKRKEFYLISVATLFVLTFFSLSKDKLQWYIIPIYPFMALVAARFMERFIFILNSNLKKEASFNPVYLRSLSLIGVFLMAAFYVVIIRDMVYYPDFNKDKVALVQIHNDMYEDSNEDHKLYYVNVAPPVLLFYSGHSIEAASEHRVLELIDDADPDQNRDFLLPEGLYYRVRDDQKEISAPLVLEVKGADGDWVLVQSLSRVDVLNHELRTLQGEYNALIYIINTGGRLTAIQSARLREIQQRMNEVNAQLTEYGYPPQTQQAL